MHISYSLVLSFSRSIVRLLLQTLGETDFCTCCCVQNDQKWLVIGSLLIVFTVLAVSVLEFGVFRVIIVSTCRTTFVKFFGKDIWMLTCILSNWLLSPSFCDRNLQHPGDPMTEPKTYSFLVQRRFCLSLCALLLWWGGCQQHCNQKLFGGRAFCQREASLHEG